MPECRIRILDEEVANKIAAGEVVERPASVVKELVENAVDAGATRITVEVEGAGKQLLRITDNGCGMTAQEAVLALQRHATSKISRAEDLAAVRTLGFRGEALPSVASVSRLSILTRARGELEGIRLEAEAGEIRELEAAAAAEGTVLTIRDLFYNTPARLKFLKTDRTELGQVCDVLTRLALSHPEISLRLLSEGEEVLLAPGSTDPLNTVTALYGKDMARDLLPVNYSRPGLAVEGYVSRPTLARPTRSGQHTFVNGRWIRNRTITHAIDEGYRAAMPQGRYPFVVLHIEIDPALVDVNVHPAKSEVRFLRDWEVHRAVLDAVRGALGTPEGAALSGPLARQSQLTPEEVQRGPWLPPPPAEPSDPFSGVDPGGVPAVATARPQPQLSMPELRPAVTLRAVVQLWNRYIVAEGPSGLMIIDQHLAHERVLFDRLRAAGEEGEPATQRLAVPLTLHLSQRELVEAGQWVAQLARVGFELEPFGRGSYVLRAAPAFVQPGSELATVRALLDEWLEHRGEVTASDDHPAGSAEKLPVSDRFLATAACKAAVKKGSRLGAEEMTQLMEDLGRCSNPHTCPHGCPISVEIGYQELLKRFKRV